jgi:peptidoglycan hydrolase CwlO-like protein
MDATRQLQKKINDLNHSLTEKSNEIDQLKNLKTTLKSDIAK